MKKCDFGNPRKSTKPARITMKIFLKTRNFHNFFLISVCYYILRELLEFFRFVPCIFIENVQNVSLVAYAIPRVKSSGIKFIDGGNFFHLEQ